MCFWIKSICSEELIKLLITLCLIIGVVFLGVKIQNKSSEMELDLAEEKSIVQKQIAELKKEAIKKTQTLGKVYKEINDSFEKGKAKQTRTQAEKDSRKDVIQSSLPSTEIQEPGVSVNPLDDEDKRLTTEILAEVSQNKQPSKEAMNISEMYSKASISEYVVPDKEPAEPLDMNRITEIRNIYSKALETLNLR